MFAHVHLFHAVEQFLTATGAQKAAATGTPRFRQSCIAGSRTAVEECCFVNHFGWNQILLHFHFSDYFSTPIVPQSGAKEYERSAKTLILFPFREEKLHNFKCKKYQKSHLNIIETISS